MPGDTYITLFSFSDPNESTTLTLRKGDLVEIIAQDAEWWFGKNKTSGKEGYFPPKFVQKIRQGVGQPPKPKGVKRRGIKKVPPPAPAHIRAQAKKWKKTKVPASGQKILKPKARVAYKRPPLKKTGNSPFVSATRTPPTPPKPHALVKVEPDDHKGEAMDSPLIPPARPKELDAKEFLQAGSRKVRYGTMANYMARLACFIGFLTGFTLLYYEDVTMWGYTITWAFCPLLALMEYWLGGSCTGRYGWLLLAVVYFSISIPLWGERKTAMISTLFIFPSIFYFLAFLYNETCPQRSVSRTSWKSRQERLPLRERVSAVFANNYWHLVGLYFLGNLILVVDSSVTWVKFVRNYGDKSVYNYWLVVAKVCGSILCMNGALILVPVCRTFIRWLYNRAVRSRTFAFIVNWFSLDTAIRLHKLMACVILVAAVIHALAHSINYALVGWNVYKQYGNGVWVTGISLMVVIQLMFSASAKVIRHDKFELFWYFHHLFVLFLILCLFHGRGNIGPNFWKWLILPGGLYIGERVFREQRSSQKVGIVSVTHMENANFKVVCLELEKRGPLRTFYEGQYVFIRSPTISRWQWHPFSISSAPQNPTVTLHIRNMGPRTWTDRLQGYLKMLGPVNKNYYTISHLGLDGDRVPAVVGPDNKPLITVDGPMAAPTQHVANYDRVMVIGSGIGVTPLRGTMESVVHHRFKFAVGKSTPDHAIFYWLIRWNAIESFCFMIRTVKEACDEWNDLVTKYRKNMSSKTFQIHIYVTSVPKQKQKRKNTRLSILGIPDNYKQMRRTSDDRHIWGPSRTEESKMDKVKRYPVLWDEVQLYEAMKDPPNKPLKWGAVTVHTGRPKWPSIFKAVSEQAVEDPKVGVLFCGSAVIGKVLENHCRENSTARTKFILHNENN